MGVKGFYFSLDAVFGLMLIGAATALVVSSANISKGVSPDQIQFDQYRSQAVDISYLMREEDFSAINKTYRNELVENTSLEIQETNTVADAILALHRDGAPETSELSEEYFKAYKYDTGLYIDGSSIKSINADEKASSKFVVSGHEGPTQFTVVVGE